MKKLFPDDEKSSFVATQKEVEESDFDLGIKCFDGICDLCGEHSEKWFILKEAGSGSLDSWICTKCIEKINKMLENTL